MQKNLLIILLVIIPLFSAKAEIFEVNINLLDLCPEDIKQNESNTDCTMCDDSKKENQTDVEKFSQTILNTIPTVNSEIERKKVCDSIKAFSLANPDKPIQPLLFTDKDKDGDQWIFRLYFGYTRTKYFNSPEVNLNSTRVNVSIKDFEWKERHSFEFFSLEELSKPGAALRFIDEPTNSFGFTMEKNNNVLMLSVFHMKWLFNNQQIKHVSGNIDGTDVNSVMHVTEPFDGYNAQPGEMHLLRLENTYWNINPQVGYGRKIDLIKNKKFGTLSYTPSVQVGLMIGSGYSAFTKEGEYWESDAKSQNISVKGMSFTAGQRLEYERKRMGVFVDQKFTSTKITQDFLDGTAKYRLQFMPVTFGISVKINKP